MNMIDRALKLEEDASTTNRQYYATIGKGALTAITGIAAILAFLVNSHHIDYIQHPTLIRRSLYVLFVLYGVTYILTLLGMRFYAIYIAATRDYFAAVGQGATQAATNKLGQRSKSKLKRVSIIDTLVEITAALGTLALATFLIALLHNILNKA